MSFLLRALTAWLCCIAWSMPAHAAIDPADLPPVDTVFVLSADAQPDGSIAVRWKIADGFYLYRHRTKITSPDGSLGDVAMSLPRGKRYKDEFFGDVETYRQQLIATVRGKPARDTVTLKVQYQGCADAGVCYPPQTRNLTIAMAHAGNDGSPPLAEALGAKPADGSTLFGNTAGGASDGLPLPPEQAFGFEAIAGDGNTLLLRFTPAKGYYLYRDRTKLSVRSEKEAILMGQPLWPRAQSHRDEHFGQVQVYFEPIDVRVPLQRTSAAALPITVEAVLQGCQTDGICYAPMTRKIALTLPAGAKISDVAQSMAKMMATQPGTVSATDAATSVSDAASSSTAAVAANDATYASASGIDNTPETNNNAAASNTFAANGKAAPGLWFSLLLALLGGLILNLMPCVLPVLSLKAMSLAGSGESRARARHHALWYTAGVVLSFMALGMLALALRKAGLALGWGFQLQQPLVVAVLALVMLVLGLSLSGVWYANVGVGQRGAALMQKSGPAGDFFTGVLAVVLATPCIGPFMGAALAYAFAGPAFSGLLVFIALGVGLALPFLLIGFVPALAHRLPKPGAWMETFKQLMAFPMYITAAWLVWVLAKQRGADAAGLWMLAAIAIALALWAWMHARMRGAHWSRALAVLALLAAMWPLHRIHVLPKLQRASAAATTATADARTPVPFSEARLAQLRNDKRVVFVNMTADWCVTCKANEKAVFNDPAFTDALKAANAVYMVGDYTDVDPVITAYLQRHRAQGVPLYVVYPRSGGEGAVLPTILTDELVADALRAAAR